MAVDELLRSAFEEHDETWDHETASALTHVHERSRHRSVVRRRVAAGALAAVLVPTALVVGVQESGQDEPVASAPASPSPSPGQPPAGASAQPLDGSWRSEPISDADVRRTLEEAGLGRWSDAILDRLPDRPFVSLMRMRDRRINIFLVGPDGRPQHYDGQESNVVGDDLRVTAIWSRVATRYRWRAETRGTGRDAVTVLDLDLEATTEHPSEGIPGEVWQRVLYTSAPFLREGRGVSVSPGPR